MGGDDVPCAHPSQEATSKGRNVAGKLDFSGVESFVC